MSASLESRLEVIDLTEVSTMARSRTVSAAREQVAARGAQSSSKKPRWALGAVVVTALLCLTPPGISLARSIGDLVGIGDEPSKPLNLGSGPSDQMVTGVGETPNGTPYELAAGTGSDGGDKGATTCFYVSFPTISTRGRTFSCLTAAALRALRNKPVSALFSVRAPAALRPESDLMLTGAASDQVARVSIEYPTDEGVASEDLQLAPFEAAPRTAGGGEKHAPQIDLKGFVAFLPFELEPAVRIDTSPETFEGDLQAAHEVERRYQRQLNAIRLRAYDDAGDLIAEVSPGDSSVEARSLSMR